MWSIFESEGAAIIVKTEFLLEHCVKEAAGRKAVGSGNFFLLESEAVSVAIGFEGFVEEFGNFV